MSKPEHIGSIIPRTLAYKAVFGEDAQTPDFDLKTAQKSLDELTEPIPSGLTMLQIELIAEHFGIDVKKIETLLRD